VYKTYDAYHYHHNGHCDQQYHQWQRINYRQVSTSNDIEFLITNVRNDYQEVDDFLISWIHSYRSSAVYADSTDDAFIVGLQSFLDITEGNIFINDVMIDTASNSIKASRLHIRTLSITSSTEQANMMVRIRDIVNSSPLPVEVYKTYDAYHYHHNGHCDQQYHQWQRHKYGSNHKYNTDTNTKSF
jgi:hypothetical protein